MRVDNELRDSNRNTRLTERLAGAPREGSQLSKATAGVTDSVSLNESRRCRFVCVVVHGLFLLSSLLVILRLVELQ